MTFATTVPILFPSFVYRTNVWLVVYSRHKKKTTFIGGMELVSLRCNRDFTSASSYRLGWYKYAIATQWYQFHTTDAWWFSLNIFHSCGLAKLVIGLWTSWNQISWNFLDINMWMTTKLFYVCSNSCMCSSCFCFQLTAINLVSMEVRDKDESLWLHKIVEKNYLPKP